MGNHVTRREFIARPLTTTALKNKPAGDPFFDKYANKELPVSASRTSSGLAQYAGEWTTAEIRHLLRRVSFGAPKNAIDLLSGKTMTESVDFLIDTVKQPASYPVNVYQNTYPDTQGCPFGESWVYLSAPDNLDASLDYQRLTFSFMPWSIGLMIEQDTNILEKITLFWSNHFGAQTKNFYNAKPIWQHYNTLRMLGLGNFRALVKAVTIDPHMLAVLNGNSNMASAPDENYARELQELFTVGKGPASGYTENDVKEAAKVLTGWRRSSGPDGFWFAYFKDDVHDQTDKQFSAFYNNTIITSNGQNETDALIDMILAKDEVSKYVCRCLYRWFVYYVIDDATEANVITPLAQIFRDSNYEIVPVLKALFKSEHFFDQLNRGCMIKSPIDMYVGFAREFNIQIPTNPVDIRYKHWQHFQDRCDEVGQRIADPPNIAGWPAYYQQPIFYQAWINSDTIQKRSMALSNYTIDNGYPISSGYSIKIDPIAFIKQFSNPEDPTQVVKNFCSYLLPQPVTDDDLILMKANMISFHDTKTTENMSSSDHYWTDAWNLYLGDINNATNKGSVTTRLYRLLTYILGLEEYQLC